MKTVMINSDAINQNSARVDSQETVRLSPIGEVNRIMAAFSKSVLDSNKIGGVAGAALTASSSAVFMAQMNNVLSQLPSTQAGKMTRALSDANRERVTLAQQLADVTRERDMLHDALRRVCDSTGVVSSDNMVAGPCAIVGADLAIEWIESAKRVL